MYSRIPDSDKEDLNEAIAAAQAAFPVWSETPSMERSRVMLHIVERIEAVSEELVRAEFIDTGRPISLARDVDVPRASSNLRFFAGAATQFFSESHAMEGGAINYTLR